MPVIFLCNTLANPHRKSMIETRTEEKDGSLYFIDLGDCTYTAMTLLNDFREHFPT